VRRRQHTGIKQRGHSAVSTIQQDINAVNRFAALPTSARIDGDHFDTDISTSLPRRHDQQRRRIPRQE
jgi:hypothetical protein